MDGEAASRQRTAAVETRYHYPVLGAIAVLHTQQHRLALGQLLIDPLQIAVRFRAGNVVAGPVQVAGGRVAQLLGHTIGANGSPLPGRFHHGYRRGGTADLRERLAGGTNRFVRPAAVILLEIRHRQRDLAVIAGQILGADVAGFGAVIQNPAPVAAGAEQQHRLSCMQRRGFAILGARAAADVETAGANVYIDRRSLHHRNVIGMAIAKPALVVFHLPPISAAGMQDDIASLFQRSSAGCSRRWLGADI